MSIEPSAFLLLFRESTPERYDEMTLDQRRDSLDAWNGWCDDLARRGHLQAGHPLEDEGRVVSLRHGRKVIDGPFAEAKELVGGYFLVTASNLDEAISIAGECPLLGCGMTVEVRPVAGGCHLARSLGWDTMRGPGTG